MTRNSGKPCSSLSVLLILFFTITTSVQGKSWHREFTVMVAPASEDCFFVPNVTMGHEFELDFQVVESPSATGNLDITVRVLDPGKNVLYTKEREEYSDFTTRALMEGDYQVCFDNTFSTLSGKNVFVELSLTDVADDYYDDYLEDEDWEKMRDYDRGQHLTLDDVKEMIHEIRDNVRTSSHTQAMMGAMHSQDMKMAERNGEKVTMWSLIHLSFLLAIGIIQVVMIKSLFSDKSFKYRMYARMEEQGQMMQQQQADGSSLYMQ